MASIYMGNHVQDLGRRFNALKLAKSPTADNARGNGEQLPIEQQMRNRIEARVNAECPAADGFGEPGGAIPQQIRGMLEAGGVGSKAPSGTA